MQTHRHLKELKLLNIPRKGSLLLYRYGQLGMSSEESSILGILMTLFINGNSAFFRIYLPCGLVLNFKPLMMRIAMFIS
jgi:hypothetical protein